MMMAIANVLVVLVQSTLSLVIQQQQQQLRQLRQLRQLETRAIADRITDVGAQVMR
jgi:hypothetical protein